MDSWEGSFNWQSYALEGRPDLLNYLRQGDVTWEQVWELYRSRDAEPAAMMQISGLFHAFMSSLYDRQGCHLDEDGEVCRQLRAWAAFVVEEGEALPEARLQETLGRLGDQGMVTDLYYDAVHRVYMEALLDRYAEEWRAAMTHEAAPVTLSIERRTRVLPASWERRLAAYYPEPSRFPELSGDPDWENSISAFLADHYQSWNCAFAHTYTMSEEDALLQEVGGEG